MKAPLPTNEEARLKALQEYKLLDTAPERDYDDLVALASQICGCSLHRCIGSLCCYTCERRVYRFGGDIHARMIDVCTFAISKLPAMPYRCVRPVIRGRKPPCGRRIIGIRPGVCIRRPVR